MSVLLMPVGNDAPYVDASGNPLSGGLMYFYASGSSTPQNTFTDSGGLTTNANPVELNSNGYPASGATIVGIWGTTGLMYKAVLKTSAGVTIWTRDGLSLINDTAVAAQDEWIASGLTPTYVSATSFTLAGDQTSAFHVGRKVKTTNSGGTIYSKIVTTAYGALTTVTVANDSGTLDSGLSAVSYGGITALNTSISGEMIYRKGTAVASAATTNIWNVAGDYVHITGSTGPITSFGTAPYAGDQRTIVFDSTPTITYDATSLILPGAANIVAAAGDRAVVRADTTANMIVVAYTRATGVPVSGIATQAIMETATSLTAVVAPGVQQYHPGMAKAWVDFTLAGGGATVNASYNVTSVTRNSAGDYTINFTTAFSAANYGIGGTIDDDGANYNRRWYVKAAGRSTGSCTVVHTSEIGAPSDTGRMSFTFFGDQ